AEFAFDRELEPVAGAHLHARQGRDQMVRSRRGVAGAPAQRQRTDFLRRTEPGVLEGRGRGASNLLETAADPRAELRAIVAGGKLRSGCERRRRARCDANALQTI